MTAWRRCLPLALALATAGAYGATNQPAPAALTLTVAEALAFAEHQAALSNFSGSIKLYDDALAALNALMKSGRVDAKDGRTQWRSIKERRDALMLPARQADYAAFSRQFSAERLRFVDALASTDVFVMAVALRNSEQIGSAMHALFPNGQIPGDLPSPPDTRELRAAYTEVLSRVRREWLQDERLTHAQTLVLSNLVNTPDLAECSRLLERARTAPDLGITLPFLERIFDGLAHQEPYQFIYWYGLGNSRLLQGRTNTANYAWHEAVAVFPESLYVHYYLARTCGATSNEAERAIAHVRWLRDNADNADWRIRAYQLLAERLLQLQRFAEANREAERAVALAEESTSAAIEPVYIEALRVQCGALVGLRRYTAAVSALEKAERTAPDDYNIKRELADLKTRAATASDVINAEMARSALALYDELLHVAPSNLTLHASKAYLHLMLGNIAQAQDEAIREITLSPRSASALATLGFAYLAQAQTNSARVFFQKALAVDPESESALSGLETLGQAEP